MTPRAGAATVALVRVTIYAHPSVAGQLDVPAIAREFASKLRREVDIHLRVLDNEHLLTWTEGLAMVVTDGA